MMPTKDERNTFSVKIENMAMGMGMSHIEAITHYCDEIGLEVEVAATLVNDTLKYKIESEAQNLRYLPRGSKLPI
ncbi:Phage late-transcription coactivator [uncultured Caudovirales phage]|uniref:Phage late-transcription coactivator n=1 Tax=uncultured Caudovirales phage TaxID=2100421 RepID=A0A6J5KPB1_9CAUD|nr:Phage late-transcription coactivator [uncultured Caudovirales phage]